MKTEFTDQHLKTRRSKPRERAYLINDPQTQGLGAFVRLDGPPRFFVQGKVNGRKIGVSIGYVGEITVEQARTAALAFRALADSGIDPRGCVEAWRPGRAEQGRQDADDLDTLPETASAPPASLSVSEFPNHAEKANACP